MKILPGRTAKLEAFVAPARARPQLWRLAAGATLATLIWIAFTAGLFFLGADLGATGGRTLLLGFLGSFAGLALGVALAARLLQRRGVASLIGPGGFSPAAFAAGVAVLAVLAGLGSLPLLAMAPPVRQASLAEWAAWLPLALPLILLQTAAEELAFRGYLMQGLAARFRSRWVWWVIPAVGFGLLHWSPAEFGPNAGLVVLTTTLIGLILGDVTARTGNLSLAMGLHFSNNAIAILLVAAPSPLGALSLYLLPVGPTDPEAMRTLLMIDLASTAAAYAGWLAFCALRRPGASSA
jgi:membrane protease YdiL (CAAX protease family)